MTFKKIFFIGVFALFLTSPPTEAAPEESAATQIQTSKKIYTVIEFESMFMNKRQEEILKILGKPGSKSQVQEKEVWKYNQVVKDKGKIWDQNILFDFGRVNYIWSEQPSQRDAGPN